MTSFTAPGVAALQRNAQESIPANRAAASGPRPAKAKRAERSAHVARADLAMAIEREGAPGLEYRG